MSKVSKESSKDTQEDSGIILLAKQNRSGSVKPLPLPSPTNNNKEKKTASASKSSSYSSKTLSTKKKPPSSKKDNNGLCCQPDPCCPQAMCYDPKNQTICQANCQMGVIPMRSAAFEAPCIPLPKLTERVLNNDDDDDECPDEDGVQFQFKPQTNCRTEVTFTIEPKPQPPWLTMLNCGFKPMVNCSAPPCYLSSNGNPGMNFTGGMQSFVNRSFGSQVNYCGMANFPTLNQIQKTFPGSCVICEDKDGSSSSSASDSASSPASSDSSESENEDGTVDKKKKKRRRTKKKTVANASSSEENYPQEEQRVLSRSSDWH